MVPATFHFSSNVATGTGTLKTSAGVIYSFRGENRNAAGRWLQLWDTAGAAGTGTLIDAIWIAAGAVYQQEAVFYEQGVHFQTGITWGFSTTATTYTAGTATDHTFAANWN